MDSFPYNTDRRSEWQQELVHSNRRIGCWQYVIGIRHPRTASRVFLCRPVATDGKIVSWANAIRIGAVARRESDDKSRRIKSKHAELALAGKPNGGTRPIGYESDHVTMRSAEAKVIRDGARMLLRGHSIMSVVKAWNAAGSKTVAGRSWYPSAVRRVLMSARIGGMREHEDEIVGKAIWPAIISAIDSTRLRALLRDPAR